jgi:hypothetical protein
MDLEEQRLKQRVDVREEALKEKVRILKERIEDLKRMTEVKSQVESRPVLVLAGSVLAGFIARKFVGKKNQRSADSSRAGRQGNHSPISAKAAGGLPNPVTAILSVVATRAVVGIVTELAKKIIPHRHEKQRNDRSQSHN